MLFYKHEQCMTPDNCTKYEQNHHIFSLRYHNKHRQILFYMHQQPMVLDHGTQYEENSSSHHGRKREVGRLHGTINVLCSFLPLRSHMHENELIYSASNTS